jgi:hypothetical protein
LFNKREIIHTITGVSKMAIKKAYQEIMSLLAANMDKKVKTIYEQVEALASAKTGGGGTGATSFHKDEDGNIIALFCSYHGLWFRPSEVDFGKKASAASGFNTMCKDGMSKWTKQLSTFKKAKEQLLEDVGNGDVAATDIGTITATLQEAREAVVPMENYPGYASVEDLLADADRPDVVPVEAEDTADAEAA